MTMSFAVDTRLLLYASDSGSSFHRKAAGFLKNCLKKIFTHNRDFLKFPFLKVRDPLV